MTSKGVEKKIHDLSREVATLRSLVVSVVRERDPEGKYNPRFVRAVLRAAKEEPAFQYKGKGSLLDQVKRLK